MINSFKGCVSWKYHHMYGLIFYLCRLNEWIEKVIAKKIKLYSNKGHNQLASAPILTIITFSSSWIPTFMYNFRFRVYFLKKKINFSSCVVIWLDFVIVRRFCVSFHLANEIFLELGFWFCQLGVFYNFDLMKRLCNK